MAQKAREIKRRMRSVENTKKITRTMEMVAASKLRRARKRAEAARPYGRKLTDVLQRLATPELAEVEPLLRQPEEPRRAAVILLTSDRGLCGPFNSNLIREARGLREELEEDGIASELHVVGRQGLNFFRFRDIELASSFTDVGDAPRMEDARRILGSLADRFAGGELDALHVVYGAFRSVMETPPVRMPVLPVTISEAEEEGVEHWYILDPSPREILARILPLYVTHSVYRALVETAAAEQAARRTAMKNATDNADELQTELKRSYNRARQAEVTQQIAEIMGGAEALADAG